MLDADAVTPVPGKGIVEGRDTVTAVLRSSLLARGDKIGWTPIRGGVSADGTHGFTFGYLTLEGGDPRVTAQKYLSYWLKRQRSDAHTSELQSLMRHSYAVFCLKNN